MHYYNFNISDYRAATAHLSNEEDLAYRRLLDMYYDTENKIPLDTHWVSKRLRIKSNIIQSVLDDFFTFSDDGWEHKKCDEIISVYHKNAIKNKENGQKGGRPKKTQWEPNGNPLVTQPKPNQKATNNYKLETNNQNSKFKPSVQNSDELPFEQFWRAYPKKVGKIDAQKIWAKLKPNFEDVIAALSWQVRSTDWVKENGKYIPNPSTYLNQGRWHDEQRVELFGELGEAGRATANAAMQWLSEGS